MPIFMIFEPHLLPQLSEKRDERENCMKINVKQPIKPLRKVKQTVLIVGGGWISGFAVERGKSDFCDN